MNSVYKLLPTFIPSELCDKIYLFVGIQTPSCIAFLPYNQCIHKNSWFIKGTDTIWSLRSRLNVPDALRFRPCGTWNNVIDLDIIVAYHTMMIDHLTHYCTCHARPNNSAMHVKYITTTYSCDNTRITKLRKKPL